MEWQMFIEIFNLDNVKDHSMQVGEPMTVQAYNALMHNYDPYLRKNAVKVTDPVRTMEMLEWCRDNVTGFWPTWRVHINQLRAYEWETNCDFHFFFSRKQDAAQFKLTFA
jgi:hypothetical protein